MDAIGGDHVAGLSLVWFHGSHGTIGFLAMVPFLAAVTPLAGALSDRVSRRALLTRVQLALFALAALLTLFTWLDHMTLVQLGVLPLRRACFRPLKSPLAIPSLPS